MKAKLTSSYIKSLMRDGVDEDALYNFLGTLPIDTSYLDDISNLDMDTRLYKWNSATRNAIYQGIKKAF